MAINQGRRASLRAAVIGLGAMGRHHARIYAELPDVELVGVSDVFEESVRNVSQQFRVQGFLDASEMLAQTKPDVVSIVVPTGLHRDVSMLAMSRGVHVLVEKPIATTRQEAVDMIDASHRHGVKIMVGHIERFNPAITELKKRIGQAGEIYQVIARRMGPFPDRIRDVGVVMDLATHDIDAMNFLLERPVSHVYAQTSQRLHATNEDLVAGSITFVDGVIGSLEVNWLTSTKIRELTLIGSHGTFIANSLTQDLCFYENGEFDSRWRDLEDLKRISIGSLTTYSFHRDEPLRAELAAFVDAVRNDEEVPTPATQGLYALDIAQKLIDSAQSGHVELIGKSAT